MSMTKVFHLSPEEAKRRRTFKIKGSDSNLPTTEESALNVVLRGSNNLLVNHSDFLLKIYRQNKK